MATNSRSELTLARGVSLYPRTNAVSFGWASGRSFHFTEIVFQMQPALSKNQSTDERLSSRAGRLCHSALGQGITYSPPLSFGLQT